LNARKRLVISLVILFLVFWAGAVGYRLLGVSTNREAAYYAVETITRLGARDVKELGPWGEIWSMIVVTVGFAVAAYAFSNLLALTAGGELRTIFGRRKLENKIKNMHDHYIVCGYGRTGQMICDNLHSNNAAFVVIDVSPDKTSQLDKSGYLYIQGDASDEEILLESGIKRAKALVTVLSADADNVYVTLTARGLNRNLTIVARAETGATEKKLLMAGADQVVSPPRIGAMRITNLLLRPAIVDFADVAARGLELEIDELVIGEDSPIAGKQLRESRLREEAGVMVVAVKQSDGTTILSPPAETVLKQGDTLITIGRRGGLATSQLM